MLRNNWFVYLTVVFLASCTVVQAPMGTVPNRINTKIDAFGAWIQLRNKIEGELIAVNPDTIYVLTIGNELKSIKKSDVGFARVIAHI